MKTTIDKSDKFMLYFLITACCILILVNLTLGYYGVTMFLEEQQIEIKVMIVVILVILISMIMTLFFSIKEMIRESKKY